MPSASQIREIKPFMAEEYLHLRLSGKTCKETPVRPATVKPGVPSLEADLQLGQSLRTVEKNPCFKVSKLPDEDTRDRVLSHEEFESLSKALAPHAADLVRMGYYTGMRFREIAGSHLGQGQLG